MLEERHCQPAILGQDWGTQQFQSLDIYVAWAFTITVVVFFLLFFLLVNRMQTNSTSAVAWPKPARHVGPPRRWWVYQDRRHHQGDLGALPFHAPPRMRAEPRTPFHPGQLVNTASFVTARAIHLKLCTYLPLGHISYQTKFQYDLSLGLATRGPKLKTQRVLWLLNKWLDHPQILLEVYLVRIHDIIHRFLIWRSQRSNFI
jgi:hypothetical protein